MDEGRGGAGGRRGPATRDRAAARRTGPAHPRGHGPGNPSAAPDEQSNLLDLRDEKRAEAPNISLRYDDAGWFGEEWEKAGEAVEAKRAVLDDAVERIYVRRGGTGRRTEAQVLARLTFDWKGDFGQLEVGD